MNIEQQRINFQRAYVKTDYYKVHYKKTNTTNSAFSWNNESNRYTWHDVNSAWEMWLESQKQEEVNKVQSQLDKLQEEIAEIKQKVYDALDAFNDGYFNYCQNQLEEILK